MKKISAGLTLAAALAAFSAPAFASPHPRINISIRKLQRVEQILSKAPPVFGGHKAQAGQLIHQAIEQLRQALQWANEHERRGRRQGGANVNVQGGPNGVNVNVHGNIP